MQTVQDPDDVTKRQAYVLSQCRVWPMRRVTWDGVVWRGNALMPACQASARAAKPVRRAYALSPTGVLVISTASVGDSV